MQEKKSGHLITILKRNGKEWSIFSKLRQSQEDVQHSRLPHLQVFLQLVPMVRNMNPRPFQNSHMTREDEIVRSMLHQVNGVECYSFESTNFICKDETKRGYKVTPSQPENSINLEHLISLAHYLISATRISLSESTYFSPSCFDIL